MAPSQPFRDDDKNKDPLNQAVDRVTDAFNRIRAATVSTGSKDVGGFFRAVRQNRRDDVLRFLQAGIDPNIYNNGGDTALHLVARANMKEMADLLLQNGANPKKGKSGEPLHLPVEDAINFGASDMVELLVRFGGYAPADPENGWSLLHKACEKGKTRAVVALMKAGADGNALTQNGATPLLVAVMRKQTDVAFALLDFDDVIAGMNTYSVATDAQRRNAFQLAIERGEVQVARKMIEKGAFINAQDASGVAPVFRAIEQCDPAMVRMLVDAGADMGMAQALQQTPLYHAAASGLFNDRLRAEIVETLLDAGADPDFTEPTTGNTALHAAVHSKRGAVILETLAARGANTETRNKQGDTPLHLAVKMAALGDIQALLDASANPNARQGGDGATPLIMAAKDGLAKHARALLAAGADPKLQDAHGRTALYYARKNDDRTLVGILEDAMMRDTRALFRQKAAGDFSL